MSTFIQDSDGDDDEPDYDYDNFHECDVEKPTETVKRTSSTLMLTSFSFVSGNQSYINFLKVKLEKNYRCHSYFKL